MLVGAVELGVAVYRTAALARPAPPLADGWARRGDARAVVVLLHGVNQGGWVWQQKARWIAASLPADVDVYAPLLDHAEPSGSRCIPADASSSPASRTAGGTREVPVDHAVLVAAPVAGARWVELLPSWLLRWKISAKLEEELRHHRWRTRAWP